MFNTWYLVYFNKAQLYDSTYRLSSDENSSHSPTTLGTTREKQGPRRRTPRAFVETPHTRNTNLLPPSRVGCHGSRRHPITYLVGVYLCFSSIRVHPCMHPSSKFVCAIQAPPLTPTQPYGKDCHQNAIYHNCTISNSTLFKSGVRILMRLCR